ncbi:MAG: cytochrome c oxidase subunit II [Kofleriaceae bacterium]
MSEKRRSRSPWVPVSVAIATAALTTFFVIKMWGIPSATAQPTGQTEPAPPVTSPDPKGSGATGPATTPDQPQATGSAAPTAAPAAEAGSAAGSAAPAAEAGSAAGSAAPDAGSAAGSAAPAAGSAAPAAGAGAPAPAPAAAVGELPWYEKLVRRPVMDEAEANFWFPRAVNSVADDSDMMYIAVLGLSIFFFAGITICVIYFTIKYRHRKGHKAEPSPSHHDVMEITWTIIPTIIVVFLFYYGWRSYIRVVTPPVKAVEVQVQAWRWAWNFTHSNGVEDSDLHVPVNTPVRLVMTSRDVLHAFYVPVMRTKQDIIPRRYTYVWFNATKPGTYRLNCAEYCGTDHSQMGRQSDGRRAVIVVHEPGDYERYLADKAASSTSMAPDKLGAMLFEKKGCVACHSTDGSVKVGPSFKGSFGTEIKLEEGPRLMDENYIRESLMYPTKAGRPGFQRTMPSFDGQLKEKEIEGLIAFIKSLK